MENQNNNQCEEKQEVDVANRVAQPLTNMPEPSFHVAENDYSVTEKDCLEKTPINQAFIDALTPSLDEAPVKMASPSTIELSSATLNVTFADSPLPTDFVKELGVFLNRAKNDIILAVINSAAAQGMILPRSFIRSNIWVDGVLDLIELDTTLFIETLMLLDDTNSWGTSLKIEKLLDAHGVSDDVLLSLTEALMHSTNLENLHENREIVELYFDNNDLTITDAKAMLHQNNLVLLTLSMLIDGIKDGKIEYCYSTFISLLLDLGIAKLIENTFSIKLSLDCKKLSADDVFSLLHVIGKIADSEIIDSHHKPALQTLSEMLTVALLQIINDAIDFERSDASAEDKYLVLSDLGMHNIKAALRSGNELLAKLSTSRFKFELHLETAFATKYYRELMLLKAIPIDYTANRFIFCEAVSKDSNSL